MIIPTAPLIVTKEEAAQRQVEAAIRALEMGDFDIAITLAAAAEGMFAHLRGRDVFTAIVESSRAAEHFSKKEWIAILNLERDWLKHPTLEEAHSRQFKRGDAAFMIARATSKLESWTPLMEEFKVWLMANLHSFNENPT